MARVAPVNGEFLAHSNKPSTLFIVMHQLNSQKSICQLSVIEIRSVTLTLERNDAKKKYETYKEWNNNKKAGLIFTADWLKGQNFLLYGQKMLRIFHKLFTDLRKKMKI